MTKFGKARQAPQLIMDGIVDPEDRDVAANNDKNIAASENGIEKLFKLLDAHYKPNTFARKIETRNQLVKIAKTSDLTSTEFMRKLKKCRTDLIAYNVPFSEEVFSIALLQGTKLEMMASEMQVESMARAQTGDHSIIIKAMEDVLMIYKSENETEEVTLTEQQEVDWVK